ncbi:MAG: GTP 3',8-cyclase MoaA [Oscillospiraceae bacterium]|nr:GTP 3',8-cyclase MoaA [Oscillospiraceae bacterium]
MQDTYGRNIRYLRLSVTDRCNLRCRYCMPKDGVCKKRHDEMLREEEMLRAVKIAAELGVVKVRITGGEPLLQPNILSICRNVAETEGIREVCLTTNGILLPKLAKPLREAGVQRINISLDTLRAEKYTDITRIGTLDDALRGLHAALEAGFKQVKINCVLIGGFNDDEIADFAALTKEYPVDVRFIELMPMAQEGEFSAEAYLPASTVLKTLPQLTAADADGGIARRYRLPNAKGCVGLIQPVSALFCAECNRMRLTADGRLKPCLHDKAEFSIKGLDDEAMRAQFLRAIAAKPACHKELSAEHHSEAGRSMNEIGG